MREIERRILRRLADEMMEKGDQYYGLALEGASVRGFFHNEEEAIDANVLGTGYMLAATALFRAARNHEADLDDEADYHRELSRREG